MVENFHWFLWRTTPENISPVIYVKNSFISYPGFTVLYEPAGQAVWILPDLIRRTPGNDPTAFLSSSRSHIDDVIRISYNIKIMFDNNQCCSMINEGLENMEKCLHILRMQPDGRFIEDKRRIALSFSHFAGQFQPLSLTAGESWCFLPQCEVSKSKVMQHLQALLQEFESPRALST